MKLKLLVSVCLLVPVLAFADPTTAEDWYKEGANQYNLGNFDKAVDAFKKGFELAPDAKKPAYLYNIAQSYRQANDCRNAAFFYKRYLSLAEQDTVKPLTPEKRAEVEGWITEEEKCAGGAAPTNPTTQPTQPRPQVVQPTQPRPQVVQPTQPRPQVVQPPTQPKPVVQPPTQPKPEKQVAAKGDDDSQGDDDDNGQSDVRRHYNTTPGGPPHLIVARLTGGIGKVTAGSLTIPWQGTFNLFVGYPLMFSSNKLEVDVGGDVSYTPVPFENVMTFSKTTGALVSAFANASAAYEVMRDLDVRGDLGVGFLAFTGLDDPGNPFTNQGEPASGSLAMFALRAGVSVDYAVMHNLLVTLTPFAFQYSPARSGLRTDIGQIMDFDFMLGVGYRM